MQCKKERKCNEESVNKVISIIFIAVPLAIGIALIVLSILNNIKTKECYSYD